MRGRPPSRRPHLPGRPSWTPEVPLCRADSRRNTFPEGARPGRSPLRAQPRDLVETLVPPKRRPSRTSDFDDNLNSRPRTRTPRPARCRFGVAKLHLSAHVAVQWSRSNPCGTFTKILSKLRLRQGPMCCASGGVDHALCVLHARKASMDKLCRMYEQADNKILAAASAGAYYGAGEPIWSATSGTEALYGAGRCRREQR